jgi:hypothetical protein
MTSGKIARELWWTNQYGSPLSNITWRMNNSPFKTSVQRRKLTPLTWSWSWLIEYGFDDRGSTHGRNGFLSSQKRPHRSIHTYRRAPIVSSPWKPQIASIGFQCIPNDGSHHHHMSLQLNTDPGFPCWGFVTITFLQGWIVSPAPNPQPGEPGLSIYDPREQTGWPRYTPRHWVPSLVAFYDMRGLQWDCSLIPTTTRENARIIR